MPIHMYPRPFTWAEINNAPDSHGVYSLLDGQEVIYYGRAAGIDVTIRSRLGDHKRGDEGRCTQYAGSFQYEITERAVERERELLEEFLRVYGRLPRCNSVMP